MSAPFTPQKLYDMLESYGGGVNMGDSPLDLPADVMSGAINTTVTGKNASHRPPILKRTVGGTTAWTGLIFQGMTEKICNDDKGNAFIIALFSGRVFSFQIYGGNITAKELSIYLESGTLPISGGDDTGQSLSPAGSVQPQAWLWQSELWVIIQDGVNNPVVVNLNNITGLTAYQNAVRSNYGVKVSYSTTTSSGATVAPVGSTFTINFTSVSNLSVSQNIFVGGTGLFQVTNISGSTVTLQTQWGNGYMNSGELVQWGVVSQSLPPGRMGAYGLGRNWMALAPAASTPFANNQFIALDLNGGASGTTAYGFRDSVLYSTENSFIVGGGTFCVPSTDGGITAIKFTAEENVSLGQGPLLVFTYKSCYSCQAPVDRLTWQTLQNPILTEAIISNGATGQWSTVVANSDVIFRSIDGIRSETLDEEGFSNWGNVPCSFEVSPILNADNQALLNFGSSIVFGNRHLTTYGPVQSALGVYFTGLVPLNFAPISSLRGKAPAVWDSGTWVGSNATTAQFQIMQMTVGIASNVELAFAFCLNTSSSAVIELWQILPDGAANFDNDGTNNIPIPWQFDSASLRFGVPKQKHVSQFLSNGEIWIEDMVGTVTFGAYYRPDQYPSFTPWRSWQQTQQTAPTNSQPAFLPRAGLGEPTGKDYDPSTNRPMRQFFTLQVRFTFVGHCTFLGAFLESQTTPIPNFAPIITSP